MKQAMEMAVHFGKAFYRWLLCPVDEPKASATPLEDLMQWQPSRRFRQLGRVLLVLIGMLLLWSLVARMDEVAVANGEVIPQEQIQSVQHLEGGIIEKIMVFEGDRVEVGEPLIQLQVTGFATTREEAEVHHQGLLLKKARLLAEANGKDLELTEELAKLRPELIQNEQQLFAGRKDAFSKQLGQIEEQVNQRKLDVEQLHTEKRGVESNLAVLREKLAISHKLMADKLTSKLQHLELEGQVKELEGRLNVIGVAIPRAEAALTEAKQKLEAEQGVFRNKASEELAQVEVDLAKTKEVLAKTSDQVNRTTITSPIKGVVKALKTHTIGGVVQPGETIMEIVPISDNLVIETRLNPKDIGFVKVGQKAFVKILTYDYGRFGGLDGEVISVSADSHTDPKTGENYFRVVVRTHKNYLGDEAGQFPITPGMQASCDIHTGSQAVIRYLLSPLIRIKSEAFKER